MTPARSVGDAVGGVGSGNAESDVASRWRVFDVRTLRAPDGEVVVGESLLEECGDVLPAIGPAEAPRLLEVSPPGRDAPRTGALVDAAESEDESEAREPVEPAEPVESAAANGIEAIAEPTPSATANAPTRPTCRA